MGLDTVAFVQAAAAGQSAAVARARTNKHARRSNGLSIVSRLNANFGAGLGSTVTGGSFLLVQRIAHANLTGKALISVAPVFAHYAPGGSTESQTAQDLIVKASIEPFGTVTDQTTIAPQKVFVRGIDVFTITKRAVVPADELACFVAPTATIFERTGVTTATTATSTIPRHQIARGGVTGFGANTGEGAATSDVVVTGTISNNTVSGYSAILMLGRTIDGTIAPSISIIGDSKAVATDDQGFGTNAGGWAYRACIAYPGGNHAIAGEKLRDTLTNGNTNNNFAARFEATKYATHVLSEYGTNDVLSGDSVATIQGNMLANALRFMRRGQNVVQATIPPLTDSTNGWFDIAGQTVRANEANRQLVNTWIRDSSGVGFAAQANGQVAAIPDAGWADFVDPCLSTEANAAGVLTLNGGFWQGAQSGVIGSATLASATTTSVTDSAANYTVNALKGLVVHITAGTGSGQVRSIGYNTATVITTGLPWTTVPDATSTYRIFDGNTIDGTHESTGGHVREAAAVTAKIATLMARP